MLTRLKVSGFKNLVDVDVYFGPFTCVAGGNAVGKSNLFDAIRFLSALADKPLIDAALSVRDEGGRTADVRSLFHCVGDSYATEMAFEVEMIVPEHAVDDLGQEATATITLLRYSLVLSYRVEGGPQSLGSLSIAKEELAHIRRRDIHKHVLFPSDQRWRDSVVKGKRYAPYFISTEYEHGHRVVKIHQDGGSSGRPLARLAENLPRTVLSIANAAESPTALLARREMQSWRLLQLEPTALRRPDEYTAPAKLGVDGSHLPATLHNLARRAFKKMSGEDEVAAERSVYDRVANRLSELIDGVDSVWIDRDERRELLTLHLTDRSGTSHPARALSDGSLRFLALTVLELDPDAHGVLCLEEPENGIHPERIPAMLRLLQDIASDPFEPVGLDNPLRQVIINTHSPAVVSEVPDDSLLVAHLAEKLAVDQRFKRAVFSSLPGTWRDRIPDAPRPISRGQLSAYLNPILPSPPEDHVSLKHRRGDPPKKRRVADRSDLQMLLPLAGD